MFCQVLRVGSFSIILAYAEDVGECFSECIFNIGYVFINYRLEIGVLIPSAIIFSIIENFSTVNSGFSYFILLPPFL